MLSFMPGRRTADKERAFLCIFFGNDRGMEIARLLTDPAMRDKVLGKRKRFSLAQLLTASKRALPRRGRMPWSLVAQANRNWFCEKRCVQVRILSDERVRVAPQVPLSNWLPC